jgi:hypothetical protein
MQASRSLTILVLVVLAALLPPLSWADPDPFGRGLIAVSDCEGSGSSALCVSAEIDATGTLLGCSVSYGGSNCTCGLCTTSDGKGGFSYDCSQASSTEEDSSSSSSSNGTSTATSDGGTGPTMGCMEFSDHAGGTPTSSALAKPPRWSPVGTSLCVALATAELVEYWLC